MEAFSYQNSTFLLDSVFIPNASNNISGLMEGGDANTCNFSYYPSETLQEIPVDVRNQESIYVGNSTKIVELDSGDQGSHKETPMEKKRKTKDGSCMSYAKSQEVDSKRKKKCNGRKVTEEKKSRAAKKYNEVPEEPPTSYIHVRARRGEATDSHSLAERVRREKISVRMKLLQSLVPGCDKVSGKAHMLDEIIGYVQSLQYQVEFLSMKLASVNPMFYDFAADSDTFMVKSEKLSSLASPLPSMHQSSPTQPIDFAETTTTHTTRNNYSLMDNSVSSLNQQGLWPDSFSQGNENLLWDGDDQRQKFLNQFSKEIQKKQQQQQPQRMKPKNPT